jgi:hypothetical protein
MMFPQLVQIAVQKSLSSVVEESIFLREATEILMIVPSKSEGVPYFNG